jgi:hypothetical protein
MTHAHLCGSTFRSPHLLATSFIFALKKLNVLTQIYKVLCFTHMLFVHLIIIHKRAIWQLILAQREQWQHARLKHSNSSYISTLLYYSIKKSVWKCVPYLAFRIQISSITVTVRFNIYNPALQRNTRTYKSLAVIFLSVYYNVYNTIIAMLLH